MAEPPPFDPYALLTALERRRVSYIMIGAFARVIQGTDELTSGLDVVPSMRAANLERLAGALADLGATRTDGKALDATRESLAQEAVLALTTEHGELKIVPQPAGSLGYDDLRWQATGEHIGHGLRPRVASVDDLARMVAALGREEDLAPLLQLRRISEIEFGHGLGL